MAQFTEEERAAISACKQKYGVIGGLRTPGGDLVLVRRTGTIERARFLTDVSGKDKADGVAEPHRDLALATIVYPETREAVLSLMKDYPFLADDAANKAVEISGGKSVDVMGNV